MGRKKTKENTTKEKNGKRKTTNRITEEVAARSHLFNTIQDFANAAILTEEVITSYKLCDDSHDDVPGTAGRTHHDMWASLKSVSHFNLGIALELMLKLLLKFNDKGYDHIHGLAALLDALPSAVQQRLESTYQDSRSVLPEGYGLVAFLTKPPPRPPLPKSPELATLKDFFKYFDQDVRLSTMRYSHELIEQEEWRQYLTKITVFTTFLDRVMENIGRYIDPEASAKHEGTGTGEQGTRASERE